MVLPHSRCNFIIDNKILIGAIPISSTINDIVNSGVTMIIDVQDKINNYIVPSNIKYFHFPIKPGGCPTKLQIEEIYGLIINNYNNEIIYIHCNGGHGRAGMIGAYIMGKMYEWDVFESVSYIEKSRNTRLDTSRNFIPTPETNKQIKFLYDSLGLKEGNIKPDRSDRRWLKSLRK